MDIVFVWCIGFLILSRILYCPMFLQVVMEMVRNIISHIDTDFVWYISL